jgi:hypothetical protein
LSGFRLAALELNTDQALEVLEQAWAPAGYHGFTCDRLARMCSAISSAGDVITGNSPDALNQAIRVHWQAMQ